MKIKLISNLFKSIYKGLFYKFVILLPEYNTIRKDLISSIFNMIKILTVEEVMSYRN